MLIVRGHSNRSGGHSEWPTTKPDGKECSSWLQSLACLAQTSLFTDHHDIARQERCVHYMQKHTQPSPHLLNTPKTSHQKCVVNFSELTNFWRPMTPISSCIHLSYLMLSDPVGVCGTVRS